VRVVSRSPILAVIAGILSAQEPQRKPTIQDAWDAVLPQTAPPAETPARTTNEDLASHLFYESRTEYWRTSTSFTGLPAVTGVINAPFTGVFNPNGIPYPPAFQPDANRAYSFLDFGTRGWLSDRVNTHFSVSYQQDVTAVQPGAPAQTIVETFGSNRSLALLNGSVEINSKPTDGIWAGTSLELGRQYVYGAETAAIDGAAFSLDRHRFSLTVFGGRRFSIFSDPDQRAIGGANLLLRLNPNASLEYETLWYIRGTNAVIYRQRLGPHWLFDTGFRALGGSPVDFSARAAYFSGDGRSTARLSFFQKLSNKDYTYDYTISARDHDPQNGFTGLYLGPIFPYSEFVIDARRSLTPAVRLGGAVWIRRLNNSNDQGPYDTSFEDYRADAQIYPLRKLETSFEYHQHDSDRLSAFNPTTFDDVSKAGETTVKDLSGEVRRTFGEGKFALNGGVYYRRVSLQDQFYIIHGMHQSGWLAGGWWRIDPRTRAYVDYNLDNDFFFFRPDLKNSRMLRVGVNWKY